MRDLAGLVTSWLRVYLEETQLAVETRGDPSKY